MYNEWDKYEDAISLFDSSVENQEIDDPERYMLYMKEKGKRRAKIRKDWRFAWRKREFPSDAVKQLHQKISNRAGRAESTKLAKKAGEMFIDEMDELDIMPAKKAGQVRLRFNFY